MSAYHSCEQREGLHLVEVATVVFRTPNTHAVRMNCPWVTARSREQTISLVLTLCRKRKSRSGTGTESMPTLWAATGQPSGLSQKTKIQRPSP